MNHQQQPHQRKKATRKKRNDRMYMILMTIIFFQTYLLYQTSTSTTATTTNSIDGGTTKSSLNQLSSFAISFSNNNNKEKSTKKGALSTSSSTSLIPSQVKIGKGSNVVQPRVLIAVFTDDFWVYRDGSTSKESRNRQRKLNALWNDERICNYNAYVRAPQNYKTCNVIWTFLLAAHDKTDMNMPAMRLDDDDDNDDEPLELLDRNLSKYSHFEIKRVNDLMKYDDFTLLNIRENMNDGKTPTYFNWAKRTAEALDIPYIGKCDLDAIIRLAPTLKFLHQDIPWRPKPMSTVLGCMKHKAKWNETRIGDESFWYEHFHHGTHLYLGGQFYIMSTDLVAGYLEQARQPQNYLEGHEDHDALAMIQVAHRDKLLRWISFPRNYRFWEHPVKGRGWWGRVWRREEMKFQRGNVALNRTFTVPEPLPAGTPSFLFVVGATTSEVRRQYRSELVGQNNKKVCTLDDCTRPESSCNLCYAFVVGANPNGPNETLKDYDHMVIMDSTMNEEHEPDLLMFNIKDNIDYGMGQTALYYLNSRFKGTLQQTFDMILFCQADYMLSIEEWNKAQSEQTIMNRNLLVGDIRDRDQYPLDFHARGFELYFNREQEDIHLYVGSDACFGVSSGLVPGIVNQAVESLGVSIQLLRNDKTQKRDDRVFNPRYYFVDNLGHDISTFAYLLRETALQWIPVLRHMKLWSKRQWH